ncbi:hypothetical protein [Nitrobacter sp.]|uniref:hypothetical protein n=1 Tax=Nitrobacter sp. TaxID=29420 RepID=UPI0029CAABDB|nr:hypothetical protein [Nitrobacter sp.]
MPNKSQAIASPLRADLLAAGAVATFVGLLGLWPHLGFIREIGEFCYFQGAYDEDSYILSWLLGTLRTTRALSGFALSVLYAVSSRSLDATLILSDFVFPFLATGAAYFAASQILSSRVERVLVTLLLVFANDLFSLGNLAVWTSGRFNIFAFSQTVGMIGSNLVPPYETSFLTIFRTPEPQVSFTLMFLILGLLARFAGDVSTAKRGAAIVLIAAISLLPLGYTFITAPMAAIVAGSMIVFVVSGRRAGAVATAIGLAGATCVVLVAYYWQQSGGQSTSSLATGLSYHSRAPIVTPATLASLILGGGLALWLFQQKCRQPLAFLALGCVLLPFLISNQQIVSGVMVSARDWERNVSYPLLVFGIAAASSLIFPATMLRSRRLAAITWFLVAVCAVVVWRAQSMAFRMWEPRNRESIAIVRALRATNPALLRNSSLTFEDAGISQFIQVRMRDSVNVPLTFYKVAMHFIPNMAPHATTADPSPYESLVFAYWLRTGMNSMQAEGLLRTEISRRAGTFTNYLFSFRDGWYPASDSRAVRLVELERSVAPIIARYGDYLRWENRRDVLDRPGLLISMESPTELSPNPWIRNQFIASGEAHGMTAYVYRQSAL